MMLGGRGGGVQKVLLSLRQTALLWAKGKNLEIEWYISKILIDALTA
jgi:hypothetical protein